MHAHLLLVMGGVLVVEVGASLLIYAALYRRDRARYGGVMWRALSWGPVILFFSVGLCLGRWAFTAMIAWLMCQALFEYTRALGVRFKRLTALTLGLLLLAQLALMALSSWQAALILPPLLSCALLPLALMRDHSTERFSARVMATLSGALLFFHVLNLLPLLFFLPEPLNGPYGPGGLCLFLLTLTQSNDAAQYVWGKRFGRRAFSPRISPNKTWEGLLGGALTSGLLGAGLGATITTFGPLLGASLGVALALLGVGGDLFVSALKRDLGVKDMGALLPEMGGVLDRIDSLLLATPLFFAFTLWWNDLL